MAVPIDTAVTVHRTGLHPVGRRPGFGAYLVSLWRYRHFIAFDSRSRIDGAQAVNALGRLWSVLTPVLDGAAYFFVFGVLLGTGRGVPNFVAYLIVGVFLFRYSSQAIRAGARAIVANQTVVNAFRFPRATLVVAANVKALLEFMTTFVVMVVLVLLIPPMEEITWRWLLLVPLLLLQTLFNIGASLLLARYVARWADVANLINFGMRLLLYMSAVFFGVQRFEGLPLILTLMYLNPLYCVLEIARDSLLYGVDPDPMRWIVLSAWALVLVVVGALVFWSAEETYGEAR
ncbi:ABC transporter permease [uncultured Micrococcus sp.]|uniref:ABC transporter permease n=1 Tax=uncultured Micrococcus sp. TaxID=114051 RepID=UPI0025CE11DB|nr:ABC transporter permease [uncultured Micrococcus sp.]